MVAEVVKIPSNCTGLRYAVETSLKTLPSAGSTTWTDLQPNTYNDFGSQVALVARSTINSGRMPQKGVVTDLDASGGFNQDLTFSNLTGLYEGLFFAAKRQKFTKVSDGTGSGGPSPVESIGASNDIVFDASVASSLRAGDLIFLTGFGTATNNGLKRVTSVTTDTATVSETLTAEATVPSGATVKHVGYQFATSDADIARSAGSLPQLTTTTKDMTDFGLLAGEWIFIGGDTSGSSGDQFTNAHNNGFAQLDSVPTANAMTFRKTSGGADGETEMATEASGASVTIRIFFADLVRNEKTKSLQVRTTYSLERQLGEPRPTGDAGDTQSELIQGAVFNECAFNISTADKVNLDLTFLAATKSNRDGSTSGQELLSTQGTISTPAAATAYNTSSDVSRVKLAEVKPTQGGTANLAAPSPLFDHTSDLTLTVNNNSTPNKAVGTFGAFDITEGEMNVTGSLTAFFADVLSVQAVQDNVDATLDFALVKSFGSGNEARRTGILIDIPLIALGNGRLEVASNEPITLPLDLTAAEDEDFDHMVMLHEFFYLPVAADT